MKKIPQQNCSNIFIGENNSDKFITWFATKFESKKHFILVDENTYKHCLPTLINIAPIFKKSHLIKIKSGEIHKNLTTCSLIWDALEKEGADRSSALLCLGGGVICDMGGFAASLYKRGIAFINIPTTLLAMTDASFGGKTGVDYNNLKNELGVFNHADAVLIHPQFLQSLNNRQIINGWAEVVKHALISDKKFWNKIKKTNPVTIKNWETIIQTSVKIKLAITQKDPLEKNIRKTLNFGHTFGHAIESYSLIHDKNPLLHGEAIALGMICEAALSAEIKNLDESKNLEIKQYLDSIFPSYKIRKESISEFVQLMTHDKKNNGEKINFSLLSDIGVCEINFEITKIQIKSIFNKLPQ